MATGITVWFPRSGFESPWVAVLQSKCIENMASGLQAAWGEGVWGYVVGEGGGGQLWGMQQPHSLGWWWPAAKIVLSQHIFRKIVSCMLVSPADICMAHGLHGRPCCCSHERSPHNTST